MPSPVPTSFTGRSNSCLSDDDDAAAGGAVQLGQHDAGERKRLPEGPHLRHRILTDRRIQNDQRLVRSAFELAAQ